MNESILLISPMGLAIALMPALVVIAILYRWGSIAGTALYATARMLIQLLLIGYVLIYIFESDQWWLIVAVLAVMLLASAWIAIHPLGGRSLRKFLQALVAISIGGVPILILVTQVVVDVAPWFSPRYVVPLAGMIFSTSMTAVSLAGERFDAETSNGKSYEEARRIALQAALIPIINSLFAVGLVALPGMMTGQILSGVSPLVAAQYQIVVMSMLLGATGLSAATYLSWQRHVPV